MTAKVIKFPESKKELGYKIPLYSDEEIFITISAINIFLSDIKHKITEKNLTDLDPKFVIFALQQARTSELFSHKTKVVVNRILNSVENVEIRL